MIPKDSLKNALNSPMSNIKYVAFVFLIIVCRLELTSGKQQPLPQESLPRSMLIAAKNLRVFNSSQYHHQNGMDTSNYHYHKINKRTPEFEATLNAMKCGLRILGQQVSENHNNMLMCCGLWKMKQFMKNTADKVCEDPESSKKVFDEFINDELIYGKFTRSILGDDTLDCKRYPEGSKSCERLWAFITFMFVLIIWILAMLIIGCCVSSCAWIRYRKRYSNLLKSKLADLDQTEKDLLMMDQHKKHKTSNWIKNLRTLLPTTRYGDDEDELDRTHLKKRKSSDMNSRLSFPREGDKASGPSVLYKSESVQMISGGGKSTPDSAVPPSTNSNATSQNTSTISLNEAGGGGNGGTQEKDKH